MFEGAGIADERSNLLGADGLKILFAEDGRDEFPSRWMRVMSAVRMSATLRRTVLSGGSLQGRVVRAIL